MQDSVNPLQGASGPGKYSKRTDLEYQAPEYGAGVAMAEQMQGAPLAKSADVRPTPASNVKAAAQEAITPLYAPSARPQEPITTGVDIGAGAGSEALALRQPDDVNFRSAIQSYMPVLAYIADLPNTSPETRAAIRQLRDNL